MSYAPSNTSLRLRVMARWLAIAFAAICTFECMARLDDWIHYDAPIWGDYNFEQLFRETGRGVRGIPYGRYLRWRLNADGLHGPDTKPLPDNVVGIVFGASEVFGIYEDEGRDFPRQVEVHLNASSHDHVVLNAGIPGLRIGGGVALLAELQKKYHPSWIAIYPTPTHYIGVTEPYCSRPPKTPAQMSYSKPGLRITEKVRELAKAHVPRSFMTLARHVSIRWRMRNSLPMERLPDESLYAFEVDLKCAIDGVKSLGATAIVLTHASRFGATPREDDNYWLVGWRNQYPEMSEVGFLDLERRANERIRQVALREQVILVDAASAMEGRSEWFADHAHFSNLGATALAKQLSSQILLSIKRN
jgi:hypothetical protein